MLRSRGTRCNCRSRGTARSKGRTLRCRDSFKGQGHDGEEQGEREEQGHDSQSKGRTVRNRDGTVGNRDREEQGLNSEEQAQ